MMHYLEEWLARKRDCPLLSIREKRSARFKFARPLGPHGQFAVVYLRGEPGGAFAFESIAEWPGPECDYTSAVLDGILDELFATGLGHVLAKVHFTLEKIEWHDVDSCAVAFYYAARGAVREVLGADKYPGNIDYQGLTTG
jgi:hypothetical protein